MANRMRNIRENKITMRYSTHPNPFDGGKSKNSEKKIRE